MVEWLPSTHEAMGSIPCTTNKHKHTHTHTSRNEGLCAKCFNSHWLLLPGMSFGITDIFSMPVPTNPLTSSVTFLKNYDMLEFMVPTIPWVSKQTQSLPPLKYYSTNSFLFVCLFLIPKTLHLVIQLFIYVLFWCHLVRFWWAKICLI